MIQDLCSSRGFTRRNVINYFIENQGKRLSALKIWLATLRLWEQCTSDDSLVNNQELNFHRFNLKLTDSNIPILKLIKLQGNGGAALRRNAQATHLMSEATA